jgi:hypothetical protein
MVHVFSRELDLNPPTVGGGDGVAEGEASGAVGGRDFLRGRWAEERHSPDKFFAECDEFANLRRLWERCI